MSKIYPIKGLKLNTLLKFMLRFKEVSHTTEENPRGISLRL